MDRIFTVIVAKIAIRSNDETHPYEQPAVTCSSHATSSSALQKFLRRAFFVKGEMSLNRMTEKTVLLAVGQGHITGIYTENHCCVPGVRSAPSVSAEEQGIAIWALVDMWASDCEPGSSEFRVISTEFSDAKFVFCASFRPNLLLR